MKYPKTLKTLSWLKYLLPALLLLSTSCRLERTIRKYDPEGSYSIMGQGTATGRHLTLFLLQHNAKADPAFVSRLAAAYIREAKIEGVNWDIAFVQMCLETGFLRFGNQVAHNQYNFAGLGATDDGAQGLSFPSPEIGVRAHIQHLKAYSSKDRLKQTLVDPRFRFVRRGSAPKIDQLAGKWASDPLYGQKIKRLLHKLSTTIS